EPVHGASSSTSMSPTVPSWARPFHDAEPSGWIDASAAKVLRASRERWCALAKSRRRPGRRPGRGTFAKADRLSSVSAQENRGCRRSYNGGMGLELTVLGDGGFPDPERA